MRKAGAGAGAKKDGSGIRVIRLLPARLIRVLDHALFLVLNFSPSERFAVDPDPELRVWRRRSRPSDGLLDVVVEEHDDAAAIAKPKCANRSVNSNGRANIVARIFSETGSRRTN